MSIPPDIGAGRRSPVTPHQPVVPRAGCLDTCHNNAILNGLEYLIMSSKKTSRPEPAPRVGLLAFASTNLALKTERALKDAQIPCAVIPTPPEITSDCGISLLLREEWVPKTEEALAAGGCEGYLLVFPFESVTPGLRRG